MCHQGFYADHSHATRAALMLKSISDFLFASAGVAHQCTPNYSASTGLEKHLNEMKDFWPLTGTILFTKEYIEWHIVAQAVLSIVVQNGRVTAYVCTIMEI